MYYIGSEATKQQQEKTMQVTDFTHAAVGQYVTDRSRVMARYIETLNDEINRDGATAESIRAVHEKAAAAMQKNLVSIADALRRNLEN